MSNYSFLTDFKNNNIANNQVLICNIALVNNKAAILKLSNYLFT